MCVDTRTSVHQCDCEKRRFLGRGMYVGVQVGSGDMVYGGGCEGGQDENSDYTCAEYIAY